MGLGVYGFVPPNQNFVAAPLVLAPVAVPGEPFGPRPQKGQSPGANISFVPNPSQPLDPLGSLAEVNFLSGFRGPQDRSGPAGRSRAQRDKPSTTERIRARNTNQGPAGWTRAPKIRAPQDESGPHGTDHASAGPIGALQDEPGPRNTNESGLRRTNQG